MSIIPHANGDFVLKFKIPESVKAGNYEIITDIEADGEAITVTKTVETIAKAMNPYVVQEL